MDENMKELCAEHSVNFRILLEKINRGRHYTLPGDPRVVLTPQECEVLHAALEVAGGL